MAGGGNAFPTSPLPALITMSLTTTPWGFFFGVKFRTNVRIRSKNFGL